jgi:adenine/guanine phosphoribosyltransferase-like PRPP-binding protein
MPDQAADLPAHNFWQELYPAGTFAMPQGGWRDIYPARLPDGREIALPIRALPDGSGAVASLIVNQAAFVVEDALAEVMAGQARAFAPDLVIGVPTLGLGLAAQVARRLGHARMLPLGTSRKFWYDAALSVDLRSITSPEAGGKRLYLDPRMLPLLHGARRVLVVDDVVSSGASLISALGLLHKVGVVPVAAVFAMVQGRRWEASLARHDPPLATSILGAIATPRLRREDGGGWVPEE